MSLNIIPVIPFWMVYLLLVLMMLISIRLGSGYYRWRNRRVKESDEAPINTLVGSTLGLLAFIMAFTFGLSSSRFEDRKQFLLDEMNTIETAWLRADLMEKPYAEKFKKELVDYVEVRIWLNEHRDQFKTAINKSEKIQNNIWSLILEMNNQDIGSPPVNVLFISSVNDMFDMQTKRISKASIDRIPDQLWIALLVLIIISMFEVGYLIGKSRKTNWILILALSISFSAIIMLIVDLDSFDGYINVNQQALYDMYERIK